MKTFNLYLFAAPALLLIILSSYIAGQTNISDTVGGVWTLAGSPYMIGGDTYVPADSALYIEPGVSVQFTGEFVLEVSGNIQAIGTEQDSIEFRPVNTGMYTKGLHIINGQDTCRLNYCKFLHFKDDSWDGGAIYTCNTIIIIASCCFWDNKLYSVGSLHGGAICLMGCTGYILKSFFYNNAIITSDVYNDAYGGAVYNFGGVCVKDNEFVTNYIKLEGYCDFWSDLNAYGGALCTNGLVVNCKIINNYCYAYADLYSDDFNPSAYARSEGGGIYGFGSCTIRNNTIRGNYCYSYAKAVSYYCYPYAEAYSRGGGIYGGALIENNIIDNNSCTSFASAWYYQVSESLGGGISNGNLIANNTIVQNSSGVFGGTLENCIVYYNSIYPQVDSSNVTYCCVQGGYTGSGNISGNPLFVTGPDGDYYLSQLAAGQSQQSPCVDAGNPNGFIYLGTTRTDAVPDLGTIDMGYHYPAQFGITGEESHQVSAFSISEALDDLNGHITLCLQMPLKDRLIIRIYNLLGQQVAGYENTFDIGKHILNFYPGKERCYILSATACGTQKSIKLIGAGGSGGPCRLVGW
jgi:hypothetical protein